MHTAISQGCPGATRITAVSDRRSRSEKRVGADSQIRSGRPPGQSAAMASSAAAITVLPAAIGGNAVRRAAISGGGSYELPSRSIPGS